MNWMKDALNALRWRLLAPGLAAGLWGGVLHETALRLSGGAGEAAALLLSGSGLGVGLGALLAPAESLVNRYHQRAWRQALAGALLGGVFGLAGAAAELWLLPAWQATDAGAGWHAPLVTDAGLWVTLGLIGAGCGIAASFFPFQPGRALRGAVLGAVSGALFGAGVLLAATRTGYHPWVNLALLALWGAAMALALHWWRHRMARRWLRLLTGANEDSIFPLRGAHLRLGKHERNDVPLTGYLEVYPYHCEIRWAGDHYDIIDNEQGGVVLVNYRQIREHALRPGDLIKVGTALLQYGEAT